LTGFSVCCLIGFCGLSAAAQTASPWLPVTKEDLELKDNPDRPGEPAMILYQEIQTDSAQSVETHYTRIKIFTEKGRDYGDISIPYVEKRKEVSDIQARTIGPDGQVVPADHRQAMRAKANQLWHTDSSFKSVPALTSVLSARIIPANGGETEYVSTRLAFERLDPEMREKLDNLFAWHDYAHSRSQIAADLASPEERAALPPQCWRMVWTNPLNGRGAIYLASHAYAVEGMEALDGRRLITELMEAATAPGTSYLHPWRKGDVVMWDNRATMHRGRPWPAHEARLMVRTTISATEADGGATMRMPSSQAAE